MTIDNKTEHYAIALPDPANTLAADVQRLISALVRIDLLLKTISDAAASSLQQEVSDIEELINLMQDKLVSGVNIKTVGGQSLLGAGDIAPGLQLQSISASTQAQPGKHYVFAQAGITLQMPTTPQAGDRIAFTNRSSSTVFVDWAGKSVRGTQPSPQAMHIPQHGGAQVVYDGSSWV